MITESTEARRPVVFLPGGVTPVLPSYAPLVDELGVQIDPLLKELEVYAADAPPPSYSMQTEVDGVLRAVDEAGLETVHLVGYSGGGAVALALIAQHPERVRSLAVFEPANVPGAWDADERARWAEFRAALAGLGPERMLAEFMRLQVQPGAELPVPREPPPPWMAGRPAGLTAMMRAFEADWTERDALRRCTMPVYLAYGLLTADFMVHRVQLLAGLLRDVWIEAYEGVHHFGPPQRTQPARYARALRHLWLRADGRDQSPGQAWAPDRQGGPAPEPAG
jgi:pimeloyl-ACP methyl ester carboxylesterase